jgi:hypothetical protein
MLESPESPRRFRKKKRFTEEQVSGILRQADRGEQTIGEICRAQGVSEQSFYRWRPLPPLPRKGGLHQKPLENKKMMREKSSK